MCAGSGTEPASAPLSTSLGQGSWTTWVPHNSAAKDGKGLKFSSWYILKFVTEKKEKGFII